MERMLMKGRKFNNRRVFIGKYQDGNFLLRFVKLVRENPKGKRAVTCDVVLTPDALIAVVQLALPMLAEYMCQDGPD